MSRNIGNVSFEKILIGPFKIIESVKGSCGSRMFPDGVSFRLFRIIRLLFDQFDCRYRYTNFNKKIRGKESK